MKKKNMTFAAGALLLLVLLLYLYTIQVSRHHLSINLDYWEHLDETALTIDDSSYTLRDLVFFVANEECLIESQARIYDSKDTNAYWNLHTNGEFVKISARNAAMERAIHDLLFYQLAKQNHLTLTSDEKEKLALKQYDFWSDLSPIQQQRLKPLQDELDSCMEQVALAEKQQLLTAQSNQAAYEDYQIDGSQYDVFLGKHHYEIEKNIWDNLNFGSITLPHNTHKSHF